MADVIDLTCDSPIDLRSPSPPRQLGPHVTRVQRRLFPTPIALEQSPDRQQRRTEADRDYPPRATHAQREQGDRRTRPMPGYRAWCFTLNNPEFAACALPVHAKERYVVWQLERGENGTSHIQGYIELQDKSRLAAMRRWLPGAHFEERRGTPAQAVAYCIKPATRVEGPFHRGEQGGHQGKRTDLKEVQDAIRTGATKLEIYDRFPEVAARYPRYIDDFTRMLEEDKVNRIVQFTARYPWQQEVLSIVAGEPCRRTIFWVYDSFGNHGKTYLATYLVDKLGAFYSNGGKAVDLTYAYCGQKIVVFDYVRAAAEFVGYGVIEQLKNGILMSTKYNTCVKRFDIPHVFVFANFVPKDDQFSRDRLVTWELNSIGQKM